VHLDPNESFPPQNPGTPPEDEAAYSIAAEPGRPPRENPFTANDVAAILESRGWLTDSTALNDPATNAWLARAAQILGPQAESREHLESLLCLVFNYDAAANLALSENRAVLVRTGAREVIRELANRILDGGGIFSSVRFKEIVDAIKATVPFRSRVIFHPLRLALAGRTGEGELDRVILLLDPAAPLPFSVKVKDTRERMLEFCAALD
jgi:hypothetical protein